MMTPEENKLLVEMHATVGEIRGGMTALGDRLDRHESTIYGNGTPGLVTRIGQIENGIKYLWSSVTAAVGAAVTAWLK